MKKFNIGDLVIVRSRFFYLFEERTKVAITKRIGDIGVVIDYIDFETPAGLETKTYRVKFFNDENFYVLHPFSRWDGLKKLENVTSQ